MTLEERVLILEKLMFGKRVPHADGVTDVMDSDCVTVFATMFVDSTGRVSFTHEATGKELVPGG